MNLQSLKLPRLMIYIESASKEKLEDIYFYCFNENALEDLTVEDLQFNIVSYLNTCGSDEITKIYRCVF
jgi:hypothetical protein